MSRKKFRAVEREAIWLAHKKKCAYTGELIDVSNFHIDHIIPESLAKDPTALKAAIAEFDLPADFDIHGYENLLPCQPRVNFQKCNSILRQTHYFLSIAAEKKPKIEENLDHIEKRETKGKALILLQQYLELGHITPHEISEFLHQHAEQPKVIFELIEAMQFADATEVKFVAKADIESLRDRPIRFGENKHIDGVTLTNRKGKQIYVRTCREYESALEQGYSACSNFEFKMSTYFRHQCGLLKALQAATTPQQSFISNPKVGIVDLKLLPVSIFPIIGDELANLELLEGTYEDKVNDGVLMVESACGNSLRIREPEGMGQSLVEVVRADFNGDDIEDILLFEYCYATHGTFGYGRIRILTRKSIHGQFETVQTYNL